MLVLREALVVMHSKVSVVGCGVCGSWFQVGEGETCIPTACSCNSRRK
jgi:hypothetical protein